MAKSSFLKRMFKLRKEETKKDPFKTGESFTTLNNLAAREAEHHALLNNMGFPSEQPLEGARYQRYSEHTSDPDSPDGVNHNIPYWVVNEASEMIYDIPDDDAPSFKNSDKAKSRAGRNTMDVKKSGIVERQVKLMKQGGMMEGGGIPTARHSSDPPPNVLPKKVTSKSNWQRTSTPTPAAPVQHEGGEIGTTAGGMNVGGRTGQSIGSQSVANYGGTATKPASTQTTASPINTRSGSEMTDATTYGSAPTPMGTYSAKPADTSVVPSDTGTRPEVGTAIFDPPTPDPELPAGPSALDLRGLTSQPHDVLGPNVGDTAPRATESNVPVTGFGSPTSREAQLQQGLTATWSPGQQGGPFVGAGANEGFTDEYQEGSGFVAPFSQGRISDTKGDLARFGDSYDAQGNLVSTPELRELQYEEGGMYTDRDVDQDVLSQRQQDREDRRWDTEWDKYQQGLTEGIGEHKSGVRRPGFNPEASGDMEKSLVKRLIKLQKSQGRMLEKQGLGEIGPTNTGGGRKMPKAGGAGMGMGQAGTSLPKQEGSMQSPRMKVSQRTPAPKPTGRGQSMGEIGLMQKQSPSEGGPERWRYQRGGVMDADPTPEQESAFAQGRPRSKQFGEFASMEGRRGGNINIGPNASPEATQALQDMSAQAERQRSGMGEFKDTGALSYKDQMGEEHSYGPIGTKLEWEGRRANVNMPDGTVGYPGSPGTVTMNPNTGVYGLKDTYQPQRKTPRDTTSTREDWTPTAGNKPSAPMQAMLKRLIKLQKAHKKGEGQDAYSRKPRAEDPVGGKRQLRWGMEPDPITGELVGTMRQRQTPGEKSGIGGVGLTLPSESLTDAEMKAQAQQKRIAQWAAEAAGEEIPKGRRKNKKRN